MISILTQLVYFTSIYIILYIDIVTSAKQEKTLPVFVSNLLCLCGKGGTVLEGYRRDGIT